MHAAPKPIAARRPFLAAFLFAAAAAATAAPLGAQRDTGAAAVPPSDWRTYNRTLEGDRYSPLDQITAANVAQLRRVCTYDLRDTLSFQTGPLVVDGTMYSSGVAPWRESFTVKCSPEYWPKRVA